MQLAPGLNNLDEGEWQVSQLVEHADCAVVRRFFMLGLVQLCNGDGCAGPTGVVEHDFAQLDAVNTCAVY